MSSRSLSVKTGHVKLAQAPNPPLQGTPEKLRFSVPFGLRPPVAPELARWASEIVHAFANGLTMTTRQIVLMCLCLSLAAATQAQMIADPIERPCVTEDLLGTWEMTRLRAPPNIDRVAHFQLLQPFQSIRFGADHSFRRIGASKQLNREDALRLLAVSPDERFRIDRAGVVTFTDNRGEAGVSAGCSFFVKDNPAVGIPAGTVSFLWMSGGKLIVLQSFQLLLGQ